MAEVLVLRLGIDEEALAHWIVVDSNGARIGPPVTGALDAAKADLADRRLIVLVPATDVLTTTVYLPLKAQAKIQQALPFALEEYLADDVEELHFAAGARRESGRMPVSIINRDKLKAHLGQLAAAGLRPDSLIAESYGLACIPGTISLLLADDMVIVNDGGDTEVVLQGVSPTEALGAIGAFDQEAPESENDAEQNENEDGDAKAMPRHVLVYCEPGCEEQYANDFIALRSDFDSVDVKLLPDGILPRLAVTVASGTGVNLLQGDFGAKTEYANLFRPWRLAATMLIAFGATGVAAKAISYVQLSQRETELRQQFVAEYQEISPGTEDVRDPAAVIQSLQARSGTSATPTVFLQSLQELSQAVQQNSEANIQAISYRGGVTDLRISAPSVSVLDNVQRLIDEGGRFEAEIRTTSQGEDKVDSRIQIKELGQ